MNQMNQLQKDQEVVMREFADLLKEQKKLEVLDVSDEDKRRINNLGFALCVHVQDEDKNQYSLLMNDLSNHKDVHRAKIKLKYLKSLDHPTLIKQYDDFTIGQFYVIQIERIHTSLFNWINDIEGRNPVSELNYVEIAIQMLDATFYLNKNKCSLYLESTLSTFVIDNNLKIKLIHFVTPQTINIARVKSIYNHCREQNELFYYRIDLLKMSNKCNIQQILDIDYWAVGICLYYLSGSSSEHILNYLTGEEPFRFSEVLGFQNNVMLWILLYVNQEFSLLSSFQRQVFSLQQEKERLKMEEGQQRFQSIEQCQEQQQQTKEDFETYLKIHKSIYNNQLEISQQEELNKLIVKYDQFIQFYQLLTKIFIHFKNLEEAQKCCEKMIEINPDCDTGYFNLGIIANQQQRYKESIGIYKKYLVINPYLDGFYQNIGGVYFRQDSYEAILFYKKGNQINPNNVDIYYNLGISYHKFFKIKNALQSLKKAFQLNQKQDKILNYLSLIQSYSFNFEKSIRVQTTLLEIHGENQAIIQRLKRDKSKI